MIDIIGNIKEMEAKIEHWVKNEPQEPETADVGVGNVVSSANSIMSANSIDNPQKLILNAWPVQAQCPSYYGNPAKAGWMKTNLVEVACPWTLHMEKITLHQIQIHKKCATSLNRVLQYIWEHAGATQEAIEKLHYDRYSGSYNFRPIRGGSGHHLSMHAYGCAIDFDDAENEQHATKHLFQDDSLIVQAFKGEGWIWGGNWSGSSIDAMHFQAARVR